MTSKRRVVHLVSHLDHGGLERIVYELAIRTDPASYEVSVVCLSELGLLASHLERSRPVGLFPPQGHLSLLWPRQLATYLERHQADIVHCHSGVWLKSARAAEVAGINVIYTEHGRVYPEPTLATLLDRYAARLTHTTVAVSPSVQVDLTSRIVPPDIPVHLVPNGVSPGSRPTATRKAAVRAELGCPEDAILVGSFGRLEPVKGYSDLIRAIAVIRDTDTEDGSIRLVIGGEGSQRDSLEALTRELQVRDRVSFLGWREDARELMSALDVFALSSYSEGTSVSLLEAMEAGVCPVVTDVGGNAAVLGDRLCGALVPPASPKLLAQRLSHFARNNDDRAEAGRAASERVRSRFGLDRMVSHYEQLYASIIADSH